MPIRGHSGVQGGAEMGCYSTALPGGLPLDEESAGRFSELWGFDVPTERGRTAPEMLDAAGRGELDVLFSSGGNFLDVLPDPGRVRAALERTPLRVHMDIVVSSQMLAEPGDAVLVLPAATRYEIPGGVTETTTERRVVLSPEVEGPRIDEARAEWDVLLDLARRVRPELARQLDCNGTPALRQEIARAVPAYEGIAELTEGGDSFQYGGRILCEGREFPTPDGRAHFALVRPPEGRPPTQTARCCSPPAAGSSSTRWSRSRTTTSPAPPARRFFSRARTRSAKALPTATRSPCEARRASSPGASTWRRSPPATSRSIGPRATR